MNAVIESVWIGDNDHGGVSAMVSLQYETGCVQGFGGCGESHLGRFIAIVLHVVGVDNWDDLPGKAVRVQCTNVNVACIGNIIKERWCNALGQNSDSDGNAILEDE